MPGWICFCPGFFGSDTQAKKTIMRAKFVLQKVTKISDTQESLEFMAVSSKPFDQDGNSEDNSFARWTPSGSLNMTVSNPNLIGKLTPGQKFYLDFTPAE